MNWSQVNDGRWVTDCGCRVVESGPWAMPWIARNSHGTRIAEHGFKSVEQAKACVEQYMQQRTDAGLYPYNR